MIRNLVGGRSDSADFSAEFSPTASLCVWAINTHLGRVWKVVEYIGKVIACVASASFIL